MRRHVNLYSEIISFQNLLKAARLAQRCKRFKIPTARFNFQLERELWQLHEELAEKLYVPGQYRHFVIHEPKRRVISAAPYRDRVVHHAIHNVLEPIFDPTFIHDSYATRKEKGTHAALDLFQSFSQVNPYVLKCDIQKYFPSINTEILARRIQRKVSCVDTLFLIDTILKSHDGLAENLQPASGIPIGNLTSQFFANIYLNGLDHFIKEQLNCRYYLRYMDDFVVFHHDKLLLGEIKVRVVDYLSGLKLKLHENKCRVYRVQDGVPFLGMIVFPQKRRLLRKSVVKFKRRMKKFQELYESDDIEFLKINQSVQAWIGHAAHADTMQLRK